MRKPDITNTIIVDCLDDIGQRIAPWVPPWLRYLICIPFCLLVIILAMTEYFIRVVITPARYWGNN